jgi:hypothetical protein
MTSRSRAQTRPQVQHYSPWVVGYFECFDVFRLQLHQDSPYTADDTCNDRWRHRPAVGRISGNVYASIEASIGHNGNSFSPDLLT